VLLLTGAQNVADFLIDPAQSSCPSEAFFLLLGRQQFHFNIKLYSHKSTASLFIFIYNETAPDTQYPIASSPPLS